MEDEREMNDGIRRGGTRHGDGQQCSRHEELHSLRTLDGVLNISAYKVETLRPSLMWAGCQAAWPGCFKGMRN